MGQKNPAVAGKGRVKNLTPYTIKSIIKAVYNRIVSMDWGIGFKHGASFRMFEQKNVMTSLLQCCLGFSVCTIVLFCLTSNLLPSLNFSNRFSWRLYQSCARLGTFLRKCEARYLHKRQLSHRRHLQAS